MEKIMTDSTAFALIIASFFPGVFFVFYFAGKVKVFGDEICTGVVQGVSVSQKHRWMLLYVGWFSWACGVVGVAAATAVMNILIAANVANADVKLAAYIAAFLHGVVILFWLGNGPLSFAYYRSVLRQAEAD